MLFPDGLSDVDQFLSLTELKEVCARLEGTGSFTLKKKKGCWIYLLNKATFSELTLNQS